MIEEIVFYRLARIAFNQSLQEQLRKVELLVTRYPPDFVFGSTGYLCKSGSRCTL
jgi:hypothetical protein